ncbi:MAG: alanine--tRNA ligase [Bacteroidales bacterium]|nr:alanine--tRNA ligase [Bacteroidales bacterium]
MDSRLVRRTFLDFFRDKQHTIVSSAPMVVKDDPTLMFTNAGMNQFKDIFLGNRPAESNRVADTQKCLRVSGKHNDLEEVGHDTYHHTMFEMLGNWSFGDYFKKEAIAWGWELLTEVYGIDKDRLYVTVFGGDKEDGLEADMEAFGFWKAIIPENHIIFGSKKDNFWEMGETGPCGPCSEIHCDLRDDDERAAVEGSKLVNQDHPGVIEIWNLVFIEFNRMNGGKLVSLPARHVDTGMGFERLCMVLQGRRSNYDTDVFRPLISHVETLTGMKYGKSPEADVAMRVVVDHLRAIVFSIADGQLPSNTGAGYVIRRILRRAVRYAYTFLDQKEPLINKLVSSLIENMGEAFPEIVKQNELITSVIREEELSFLNTLEQGIRRFEQYTTDKKHDKNIDGNFAFELYDTFGFPVDLTGLMARERGWTLDMEGFKEGLQGQKDRSRKAAEREKHDWTIVSESKKPTEFLGYDQLEARVNLLRYRKVSDKKKSYYELVLDQTPFYAESGGQAGDKGVLKNDARQITIFDTKKENDLIIHLADKEPAAKVSVYTAIVDKENRWKTENNHSATHLMHHALRKVLGDHVEQKGSLVDARHLRFDFSHFQKMSREEIEKVEQLVNCKIRENNPLDEHRALAMDKAMDMGALAFFGEKYGEHVRVVRFGDSVELCGGTHVPSTGRIGFFKIISEGAIAAGVRRIEAITADEAEAYVYDLENTVDGLKGLLKNPKDLIRGVQSLIDENKKMQKQNEALSRKMSASLLSDLSKSISEINGIKVVAALVDADTTVIKNMAFELLKNDQDLLVVLGNETEGKAFLTVAAGELLIRNHSIHAGNLIRQLAVEIKGGGGGQAHFATAGGKDPLGLQRALDKVRAII